MATNFVTPLLFSRSRCVRFFPLFRDSPESFPDRCACRDYSPAPPLFTGVCQPFSDPVYGTDASLFSALSFHHVGSKTSTRNLFTNPVALSLSSTWPPSHASEQGPLFLNFFPAPCSGLFSSLVILPTLRRFSPVSRPAFAFVSLLYSFRRFRSQPFFQSVFAFPNSVKPPRPRQSWLGVEALSRSTPVRSPQPHLFAGAV